ncbi:MAG: hypothetical protein WA821_07990 [Anaerolineales bacterium]
MSRQKRNSKALEKAQERANNLESIDGQLDLGFGLTLTAYQAAIAGLQTHLKMYNDQLSALDAQGSSLLAEEKNLSALTERMLEGVSVKYGKDSIVYKQAGGVRKSERKKSVRKPKSGPGAPDLPEGSTTPI